MKAIVLAGGKGTRIQDPSCPMPKVLREANGKPLLGHVIDKLDGIDRDDVNLDVGRMRIRRQGSSGGQKGVADIITCLGSDAFPRIKIGVGKKPSPEYDLADWVLGRFSADDEKKLADVLEKTADAVRLTVCGRIGDAMNLYN